MSDNLEFLDGAEPAEPTVAPEAAPEPVSDGPARGPDGKFAPKAEAASEPAPEPVLQAPQPAPVVAQPEPKEPGHVPISALLDERDKRRKLEEQLAQIQQQQMQHAPQVDPYQDPAAYANQLALNTRLDMSEEMARSKHGEDVVNTARDWALQKFASNPAFQAEVLSQRNPYEYVVQQYGREQVASQVSLSELAQFQAWKAAQAQVQAQQPTPSTPIPTPSLASASAAGSDKPGAMPLHEGAVFDAVFTR